MTKSVRHGRFILATTTDGMTVIPADVIVGSETRAITAEMLRGYVDARRFVSARIRLGFGVRESVGGWTFHKTREDVEEVLGDLHENCVNK